MRFYFFDLGDIMDFHILAILGISGKDSNSVYSKDSTLNLPLKNGAFHNSTHCLIDSFGENATYTFIGTSESIKYQNEIFATLPQCKAIFEKYPPLVLRDSNEIEAIFHQIIESIKNSNSENIILDITHGFRHQQIIASFVSTLAQINTKKSITLLFAKTQGKDSQGRGLFQYISLERYSQISLIALCLQTFTQTLRVPEMKIKEPFIITLTHFSNALHANAFSQIFELLDKVDIELKKAKADSAFGGLENILKDIEFILGVFKDIQSTKKDYNKYYKLARLMHLKKYYLISATYISEAISLYILDRLNQKGFFLKRQRNGEPYKVQQAVKSFMYFMCNDDPRKSYESKKDECYKQCNFYLDKSEIDELETIMRTKHLDNFKYLYKLTTQINDIRNSLVHITSAQDSPQKIQSDLQQIIESFNQQCLKDDCLKGL